MDNKGNEELRKTLEKMRREQREAGSTDEEEREEMLTNQINEIEQREDQNESDEPAPLLSENNSPDCAQRQDFDAKITEVLSTLPLTEIQKTYLRERWWSQLNGLPIDWNQKLFEARRHQGEFTIYLIISIMSFGFIFNISMIFLSKHSY